MKPGTQLGPYEVTAPLGAGGMGEVYRARDPRLGREVAVKVLPEEVTGDTALPSPRKTRAISSAGRTGSYSSADLSSSTKSVDTQ